MILVRLYRHGFGQVTWGIPGGFIDFGEKPIETACHKLIEVTDFGGGECRAMPPLSLNPDNHTNRMHIFPATSIEKLSPQHPDNVDRPEFHPTPLYEIIRMAQNGEFLRAMHLSALFFVEASRIRFD